MNRPKVPGSRKARNTVDKQLLKFAAELGFTWETTAGGHVRFTREGCSPVLCSATPSDHRALLNAKSDLRRSARGAA